MKGLKSDFDYRWLLLSIAVFVFLFCVMGKTYFANAAEDTTVSFVFDGEEISIPVPEGCPYYFLAFDVTVEDLHNDWILIFSESPYLMSTSGSNFAFELRSSEKLYKVVYRSSSVSYPDSGYSSTYAVGKPGLNFVYRTNYDVMWSGGTDGNDDIFFKSIPLENGESFFSDAVILPVPPENIGELVVERNGVEHTFTAEYPYYIVFYDLTNVTSAPLSVFFSNKPLSLSDYMGDMVFLTNCDSDTEVMICQTRWMEQPSSTAKSTDTYDSRVVTDFYGNALAMRSDFENCVYYSNYDLCDYVSRDTVVLTSSPAPEIMPDVPAQRTKLDAVVTSDMMSGALNEIIYLLPAVMFAVIGYIGLRKGINFVIGILRTA